jgi:hypothetical protein
VLDPIADDERRGQHVCRLTPTFSGGDIPQDLEAGA